jgi:hypothetical protein
MIKIIKKVLLNQSRGWGQGSKGRNTIDDDKMGHAN